MFRCGLICVCFGEIRVLRRNQWLKVSEIIRVSGVGVTGIVCCVIS